MLQEKAKELGYKVGAGLRGLGRVAGQRPAGASPACRKGRSPRPHRAQLALCKGLLCCRRGLSCPGGTWWESTGSCPTS